MKARNAVTLCSLFLIGIFVNANEEERAGRRSQVQSATDMVIVEGTGPHFEPLRRVEAAGKKFLGTDINGDRFSDSIIGSPKFDALNLQNIPVPDSGLVHLIYGTRKGPTGKKDEILLYKDFGVDPTPGTSFGADTAICDIDNDGFAEVIVGSPGATFGSNPAAGAISIYKGSKNGVTPHRQIFGDAPNLFRGGAVTCGDYNADGFFDVAVADIGATVKGKTNAGEINIFNGPDLTPGGTWNLSKLKGSPKPQSLFGRALESGDINHDGFDDVFAGSPSGMDSKGFANIIYGSPNGLTASGNQLVKLGNGTQGDFFAFSATMTFSNNDDFADVTLGAPGLNQNTGGAFHLYGTDKGLTSTGSLLFVNPDAETGDKCGFAQDSMGLGDEFIFAFGCPGANGSTGAVDLLFARGIAATGLRAAEMVEWLRFTDGTGHPDAEFGKSASLLQNDSGKIFVEVGSPRYDQNGVDQSGKTVTGTINWPLAGNPTISRVRALDLDGLLTGIQAGAGYGDDLQSCNNFMRGDRYCRYEVTETKCPLQIPLAANVCGPCPTIRCPDYGNDLIPVYAQGVTGTCNVKLKPITRFCTTCPVGTGIVISPKAN